MKKVGHHTTNIYGNAVIGMILYGMADSLSLSDDTFTSIPNVGIRMLSTTIMVSNLTTSMPVSRNYANLEKYYIVLQWAGLVPAHKKCPNIIYRSNII